MTPQQLVISIRDGHVVVDNGTKSCFRIGNKNEENKWEYLSYCPSLLETFIAKGCIDIDTMVIEAYKVKNQDKE